MIWTIFLQLPFFFLSMLLIEGNAKDEMYRGSDVPTNRPTAIGTQIITESASAIDTQSSLIDIVQKFLTCESQIDCVDVSAHPNDCCEYAHYAINKKGLELYQQIFAKEREKHQKKCQDQYDMGLSCAKVWYEPVCIEQICKLKDKIREDKIIVNDFSR